MTLTKQDKNNAFQVITNAVNAISTTERKRDQIKHKLQKMKSEARKKQAIMNQNIHKTGGGQGIQVKLKEWEKLLLSHLEKETIEGIDEGIDTAICNQPAASSKKEQRDEIVELNESFIPITDEIVIDVQENTNDSAEKELKTASSGYKKSKKRQVESPIESNFIIENQNKTIALLGEIAKTQFIKVELKKIELSLKIKNLNSKGISVEDEDIALANM